MKLKMSYVQFIKYMIVIVIFAEGNFFRIFKLDGNICISVYTIVILVVSWFLLVNVKNVYYNKKTEKMFWLYFFAIMLFMIFEFVYTYLKFDEQSISSFAKNAKSYIFILMILPIMYLMKSEDDYKKIMDLVVWLVALNLGGLLIHSFMVNNLQIGFLHPEIYRKISVREGRLRIWDLSSLEALACIYSFYSYLYFKEKAKYLLGFLICIISLIYVEQTRMMWISIACSVLLLLCSKKSYTRTQYIMKWGSIIGVFGAGIIFVIPNVINYVQEKMIGHATITVRLREIEFALDQLKSHPWGLGLVNNGILGKLYYTNYTLTVFSMDDIGMLGYTVLVGPWIFLIYIVPMLRMLVLLMRCPDREFKIFLTAIYVYLVITSATLFILDKYRFLMWPFCLALFEYGGCYLYSRDKGGTYNVK